MTTFLELCGCASVGALTIGLIFLVTMFFASIIRDWRRK
jgi:hypothetical protein